jgi:pimeloyl-ACP methyl ester carboxylesterase
VRRTIPFYLPLIVLLNSVSLAQPPNSAVKHLMMARADVHIEVIAQGTGPAIVILPSLGRGAEDYDVVAAHLAAGGFRVLRPQPRGIGASTGPMANLTMHDYAADVATVIEHESKGPVVVVGHALGNYVARMLATDRPDLVRGVLLAGASPGKSAARRARTVNRTRRTRGD